MLTRCPHCGYRPMLFIFIRCPLCREYISASTKGCAYTFFWLLVALLLAMLFLR